MTEARGRLLTPLFTPTGGGRTFPPAAGPPWQVPRGRHEVSEPSPFTRRRFIGLAAASVAAGPLGLLTLSRRLEAMTDSRTATAQAPAGDKTAIRPFQFSFPD